MKQILAILVLLLSTGLASAESLVVQTCGVLPQTYVVGATRYDTVDVNGNKCGSQAGGAPTGATTTTVNSTISVTNTFQAALAASATRKSCLLQNTGTHTEYVYFGTIGSATTSNAFQVSPGQTISCATQNDLVLTDAISITGTAGDSYVVTSQ